MSGSTEARKPHPKNAPGPFFVEDGLCMICGVPELEAPDLMTGSEEGHCYFRKQPTTPEELEQAIAAVAICCCGAVQYGGSDPAVIARLEESEPT
jgi:hypothetical protein